MEFYELHPENPQLRYISKAVNVIKQGGVIIYPTDTVYGIGCDIFNKSAIERVQAIKNNPEIGKPMRNVRKGTREVYIKPLRISYAYLKNEEKVIFLDLYHKKKQ